MNHEIHQRFSVEPFNDAVDAQDLRREWEEWHRAFDLALELRNVDSQHDKFVLLLTCGGRGLQRIFYNLRVTSDEIVPEPVKVPFMPSETPEYDNAIKRLNKFFVGKRNERVELELFRSLKQSGDESFNQFILKLRAQAARCDFADREEREVLQQITMGARDERVRDKGLENVMGLDELTNYAINREVLQKQKSKSRPFNEESTSTAIAAVKQDWIKKPKENFTSRRPLSSRSYHERARDNGNRNNAECNRCGSFKHKGDSPNCYARIARCNNCGRQGHFARKCRDKRTVQPYPRSDRMRPVVEANALRITDDWNEELPKRLKPEEKVEALTQNDGIITCIIDNVPISFLIDSGAAINTVTIEVWRELVESKATIFKKKFLCDRKFTAYASQTALRVVTVFEAWISINVEKPSCYAEFFVIEGANKSLLSKTTAEDLKVLKIGLDVQTIDVASEPFPKFPNIQVKLSIDHSVVPRKLAYLRVPEPMKEKVDQKILEMLRTDVIEPADGPPEWISPMVVVPKGKDDIRLCINMKYPNEAIQREHYPLPVIETFLNMLRGATHFSRLDITSAFHHIELHPESRAITTFMTDRGLMRFKRLMFGINCAPEIFQRIMKEMLAGIDGVIVYIDDIVVAGRTQEEHDRRLREVLTVLKKNKAKLNESKCVIGVKELEILGFRVSCSGISPSNDKILAIKNFRRPETKEEVRSFLGLVNFVGHFIPHLSTRTEALRQFVRGEVPTFGEQQEEAFDDLRQELSNNVRKLGFYDPNDVTELYVDASPVGLGAVLVQKDQCNTPRIISFASKGLTVTEQVYPQTQREALAVVWAVEKFYLHLFGLHFTIFTDHKTLEYIYGGKHRVGKRAISRAEGWALRLQPYNFEIKHIPGSANISDVLSRLPTHSSPTAFDDNAEHYLCAVGEGPLAITLDEIRYETTLDEALMAVVKALETKDWPAHLFRYQAFCKELGWTNGIVVREERIVLPTTLRPRALSIAHRGHPGVVAMRRNLREKVWWPCMDRDVVDRIQECSGCAAVSCQGPPEPMQRKEMPERAWQEIAIDFFSAKEYATFLVVVDYFSRFLKVIEMKSTTAAKTIDALEEIFNEQTYPETIRSDNGPPFSSAEFSDYCVGRNIRLIRTIPYWPQMNGLVERQNQGILRTLRIAKATNSDWRKAIKDYIYMYNTTPHSVTDKAPMELLTGRPVKDLLPSLRTDPSWQRDVGIREKDAMKKMQGKIYADQRRHAKLSEINVGDAVMLRNYETGKLEPKFRLERFTVIKKSGNDTVVANEEGVMFRRCVTHLRKWPSTPASPNSALRESPSTPISTPLGSPSSPPPALHSKVDSGNQQEPPEALPSLKILKRQSSTECIEPPSRRSTRNKQLPRRYLETVHESF